jgi:flagellar assembly factor FliW
MKTVEGDPGPPAWTEATASSLRAPSIGGHDGVLATRFGPVPLDPDRQVRFRGGLPGFPSIERFQLEPLPGLESELMLLQAIEAPEIGFITLPLPIDMPVLRATDVADVARLLDIEPGELMILAIVTLAQGAAGVETSLNLRAPLFIDVRRRVGAQVVLGDPSYPLRHRINTTAA